MLKPHTNGKRYPLNQFHKDPMPFWPDDLVLISTTKDGLHILTVPVSRDVKLWSCTCYFMNVWPLGTGASPLTAIE